ncbi:hypothetical protein [Nocardia arthritidis]|uniref:hypothetical protein n=1 Tax=Nocardia arthritidis TaxID=228602 RepID=UPI00142E6049|nr:hypothetical protein [Nocardia arthritidis]
MDLRMPMRLFRDRVFVGSITRYGFETPWATGLFEDSDPRRGERSDSAVEFLQWLAQHEDDLPDDDNAYNEFYDRELSRHRTTRADVDWCETGSWAIATRNGTDHEAYSFGFIGDRWVQWRW